MNDKTAKPEDKKKPSDSSSAVAGRGDQVNSTEAAASSDSELSPTKLDSVTGGKAVAMGPDLWE